MSAVPFLGAQGPKDDATDTNAIAFIVERLMNKRTHVELVEVVACTNAPGTVGAIGCVSVKPLVNQVDGYGNAIPHGTVYGLNYFRYGGGKNAVILDPEAGDIGVVVVADRDTATVKSTGAAANPASQGRTRREYGIYFGLGLGQADVVRCVRFTDSAILVTANDGSTITIFSDGNMSISSNGSITITVGDGGTLKVDGDLAVQGNITATGTITPGS
jgi:hypothetical protein